VGVGGIGEEERITFDAVQADHPVLALGGRVSNHPIGLAVDLDREGAEVVIDTSVDEDFSRGG